MVSNTSTKKKVTKTVVKEEDEEETVTVKSMETMRSRLRGFAFTSSESAATEAVEDTITDVPKLLLKSTKKRKRSISPTNVPIQPSSSSPRKPKVYKMELDTPHPAPANWEVIYRAIEEMRKEKTAPVDSMGCHMPMLDSKLDQQTRRFITLVSLMLSSQTKDEVTFAAIQNLRERLKPANPVDGEEYLTLQSIRSAPISLIEECINKVGFWRRKAQYIKSTVEVLHKEHKDDIPRTIEGLCSLPGVGMKMAMLAMQVAWGDNVGIGVDVHVHRITNRLGWHRKETKTPEETRLNLESWLPKEHHPTINPLLVGFGQTVCLPVRPKCDECLLSRKKFSLEKDGEMQDIEGPLCPSAFKPSGTSPRKGKSRKIEVKDVALTQEETSEDGAKVKVEVEEKLIQYIKME